MKQQHFDVLIIGLGMVGSALATFLGENNLNVAIIDKQQFKSIANTEVPTLRVSAINPNSQTLLEAIGAWKLIPENKKAPYTQLKVWDYLEANHQLVNNNQLTFDADLIKQDFLGYIIENQQVQQAILQTLNNHSNVTILPASTITALNLDANLASITTANNQCITANLLVGADGAESFVRKSSGLGITKTEYSQHCFTAVVEIAEPAGMTTWQQFAEDNTTAFLPLASNANKHYASLIWHTSAIKANSLSQMNSQQQQQQIEANFPQLLPKIINIVSSGAFPLSKANASNYCLPNLALVGDAAHMVHPLAGQGVNMGFQDVQCLASTLIQARKQGNNIGDVKILRNYARKRFVANCAMNSVVHSIYLLFNNTNIVSKTIRNIGVKVTNRIPFLKKIGASYASGNCQDIASTLKTILNLN
jgi:2-octaprenyl-3-methyl-6-methoxy-1,4-benzoquinol hydroxylase